MKNLFNNWSLVRVFRVTLGIFIIVQGAIAADIFTLVLGVIFSALGILNVGCCASGGCSTNITPRKYNQTEDVEFEEIRVKR